MRALLVAILLLLAGCAAPGDGTAPSDDGEAMDKTPGAGDGMGKDGGDAMAGDPPAEDGAVQVRTSGHAREGTKAPAYAAAALTGDERSLADLDGKVVLLTVWASWCSICRADEGNWQDVQAEFGDALVVYAVSREADRSSAHGYAERSSHDYPMFWDDEVNHVFGMRNYQPNHVLIDSEGTIVSVFEQAVGSRPGGVDGLREDIRVLLPT